MAAFGGSVVRREERIVDAADVNASAAAADSIILSASASERRDLGECGPGAGAGKRVRAGTDSLIGGGSAYVFQCTLRQVFFPPFPPDYAEEARGVEVEIYSRASHSHRPLKKASGAAGRGELVGTLEGFVIDRPSSLISSRSSDLSELEDELKELTAMFCDSRGRATRVDHPRLARDSPKAVKSGGLFHIFLINVLPAHRGKDLGLRAIHEAFMFLGVSWSLAVMLPGNADHGRVKLPGSSDRGRLSTDSDRRVQRHFARMGFTQAGHSEDLSSAFFLTAEMYFQHGEPRTSRNTGEAAIGRWISKSDAAHEIEIYAPPARPEKNNLSNVELIRQLQAAFISKRFNRSAFQHVVQSGARVDDARALHICAAAATLPEELLHRMFKYLVRYGGNVNFADEDGNRPLHVAAASKNLTAIKCLRRLGAKVDAQNSVGKTPVDILVQKDALTHDYLETFVLDGSRRRRLDVVRKFNAVKWLMTGEAKNALVDGWLSPRMLKMLQITAKVETDFFNDEFNRPAFEKRVPLSLFECCDREFGFRRINYIPPHVLRKNPEGFFESFYYGYGMCFEAISSCLRFNNAPTFEKVRDLFDSKGGYGDMRKVRHFFDKGGKIEYALDALFGITENVLVKGRDGWKYKAHRGEIEALPANPLDGMFDVARFMCIDRAGGSLEVRGPHEEVTFWCDDN